MRARWFTALVVMLAAVTAAAGDPAAKMVEADKKKAFQAAKRGYWQEAMAQYQQALEASPDDPELLNNLAVAHEAIGEFEEARKYYDQALEIAPADRRIRKNHRLFLDFYESYVNPPEKEAPDSEAEEVEQGGGDAEEGGGNDA